MHATAEQLQKIIDEHITALLVLRDDEANFKSSPIKWSKKEIIGHMVDSAQNNIRRFIVAQYEDSPKIVYNQNKWVTFSNYQEYDLANLANLWYLLNKHIVIILNKMPAENIHRNCQTEELHTVEWLAKDYIRHLLHHLHQVLDLEPIAYR